jgi:hypothetical protein
MGFGEMLARIVLQSMSELQWRHVVQDNPEEEDS